MEDDKVGHMVELLQAIDLDGDQLWYSIIGKTQFLIESWHVISNNVAF